MVDKQSTDAGLRELALFAGAGGGILGGKLLAWRTVCAVEWEPYPASVLCARQNDKILAPFPIWDDVRTFDGKPWRGIVDVVSGGFPCQDISAAGHGAGISGSRSGLWSEMARIIGEVRPRYAFVENSPMLTSRGLGTVLGDLAALGFDARWGVISAADVGAPHLRERIWIVAHAWSARRNEGNLCKQGNYGCQISQRGATVFTQSNAASSSMAHSYSDSQSTGPINAEQVCESDIPDTDNGRRGRREITGEGGNGQSDFYGEDEQVAYPNGTQRQGNECAKREQPTHANIGRAVWWESEPNVGRVANGVAARVDRLKAIGNGQVPRVAATAFKLLAGKF